MRILVKLINICLVVTVTLFGVVFSSYAEQTPEKTMEKVEKEMPVLKGNTWVKMSPDEKISFLWGAGHIISIEDVLGRKNPELKKNNTFVNKVMEARGNSPMTMNEVAKRVDDFYKENPDKLDTPVMEVIWYQTIVPRLKVTSGSEKPAN
jgi:hypothetical protein